MELLDRDGVRIAYWDAGSGIPVVFIHGTATSGELWAADLSELTDHFRFIVYNRRGYGDSSTSPENWGDHADDAIGLIEALAAAPAMLIGYSAGSIIALDLALRRPDLVAGVILVDPAFNLNRCLTPRFLATLARVRVDRRRHGDIPAAEEWLRYVSSYSTGGSAYQTKTSAERRAKLLVNTAGIFADLASGGGDVDERRLHEIAAPVTIVEAKLSPPFLRRSCRRLIRLLPQASRVTLENSGHWVGLDARHDLIKVIRSAVPPASRASDETAD